MIKVWICVLILGGPFQRSPVSVDHVTVSTRADCDRIGQRFVAAATPSDDRPTYSCTEVWVPK